MTEPIGPISGEIKAAASVRRIPSGDWESLAVAAQFRPSAVAERCGISLRTVQRHFKKNYGTTLSEWLREFRLKLAYERLSAGESIKSVAYGLGYKQLSHFSRDFKRTFGSAPKFLQVDGKKARQAECTLRSGK